MKLTRQDWIDACHFHDLSEREVLEMVSERVKRARAQQERPLVLLDLDSTLYEVGPRTYQIIQEWVGTPESAKHPRIVQALRLLKVEEVGYSLLDTFKAIGLSSQDQDVIAAADALKPFWRERFFTSKYLAYDRPYAGAAEFTRKVYEHGAEIVYLTGRDEPGMGDGTRKNLIRDSFPWECPGTHLLLKKAYEVADLAHKTGAAEFIKKTGTLIASFENEPPNLIALSQIFPGAMHIFLDTVCSDEHAAAGRSLYKISGFELLDTKSS